MSTKNDFLSIAAERIYTQLELRGAHKHVLEEELRIFYNEVKSRMHGSAYGGMDSVGKSTEKSPHEITQNWLKLMQAAQTIPRLSPQDKIRGMGYNLIVTDEALQSASVAAGGITYVDVVEDISVTKLHALAKVFGTSPEFYLKVLAEISNGKQRLCNSGIFEGIKMVDIGGEIGYFNPEDKLLYPEWNRYECAGTREPSLCGSNGAVPPGGIPNDPCDYCLNGLYHPGTDPRV